MARLLARLYQGDHVPRGILKHLRAQAKPLSAFTPQDTRGLRIGQRISGVSRYVPDALRDQRALADAATRSRTVRVVAGDDATPSGHTPGAKGEPQGGGGVTNALAPSPTKNHD